MRLRRLPKWIIVTLFVAALVGFADASYLTAEHVRGTIPPCTVLNGCEKVLTSSYATVGGMPLAVLGMLYYGTILVLLIAYVDSWNKLFVHLACWLVAAGFLGTLYFVYVQVFVLEAFCPYCMLSALSTSALFAVSARVMRID
jgi:uncharacterized membrane protein